jgi:hypothetical protein
MGKYIIELEDGEHLYKTTINALSNPVMRSAEKVPYTEPDLEQVKKEAYNDGYQSGREDLNIVMSDVEQAKADAYLKGLNDGQGVILASTQNNAFNNGYKKCLEDMEQVRIEAYQEGKKQSKVQAELDVCHDIEKVAKENYKAGLSDAWDAARRIIRMPEGDLLNVFTECYSAVCTALQVILKYGASEVIEKLKSYEQEQDAEIKVGDEVAFHHDDGRPDTVVVVTYIGQDGFIDGMDGRGTQYAHKNPKKWTKTGRTFPEIVSVLEKMRGEQDG